MALRVKAQTPEAQRMARKSFPLAPSCRRGRRQPSKGPGQPRMPHIAARPAPLQRPATSPDALSVTPKASPSHRDMSKPPPLRLDNKSAIDLAYNPEHHSKTKHIERRHYFIRECVENGKLRVPFVPTADNVADFFTKPLTGKMFFDMRDKVMNVPRAHRDTSSDTTNTEK
eukprot:scaffold110173_cov31-Phaeocystis_antarctica.AAC.1